MAGADNKNQSKTKLQNPEMGVNKYETTLELIRKYHPSYESSFHIYEKLIYKNLQKRDFNKRFFLLDAGCGWKNREVMKYLDNSIYAVEADIDNQSLKENISYDNLVQCTLEYLPFKNETFDLITNICVLEHISYMKNIK